MQRLYATKDGFDGNNLHSVRTQSLHDESFQVPDTKVMVTIRKHVPHYAFSIPDTLRRE